MSPEAEQSIDKAKSLLRDAEAMLGINLTEAAGRTAYLAGFHAAQAYISERTGRRPKTHKGVQVEFQRLTKDDLNFASDLRSFLSQAYNLKAIADCETGMSAEISFGQAEQALAVGQRFVRHLEHLVGPTGEADSVSPQN